MLECELQEGKIMKKLFDHRSKVLFVCALLATIYVIYLIVYFMGVSTVPDEAEALGGMVATAVVMPHMATSGLGAIFSWLGFFLRKNWAALTGAILYCVGLVLFPLYFMYSAPLIILGFVGYSKQKELQCAVDDTTNAKKIAIVKKEND